MSDVPVPRGGRTLRDVPMATNPALMTFEQLWKLAEIFANSSLVPTAFQGKAGDVFIALDLAARMSIAPLAMLKNLTVIHGRPTIWGDLALTLAKQHPDYLSHREWMAGEGDALAAWCEIRVSGRNSEAPQVFTARFSVGDAKTAGLWNPPKGGPWKNYPHRMLQMRARSWAIRDALPEALNGVDVAEEVMDMDARPAVSTASTGVDRLTAALGVPPAAAAPARIDAAPKPVVVEAKTSSPNPVPIAMETLPPIITPEELEGPEFSLDRAVYGPTMPSDDAEPELDNHDTTPADDAGKRALLASLRAKAMDPMSYITQMLDRQPSPSEPMTQSELGWLRWHVDHL